MAGLPRGPARIQGARSLTWACNPFYGALRSDFDLSALQSSFRAVATIADRLEVSLQQAPCPTPVPQAWQPIASSEVLLRQQLNLPTPPEVRVVLRPADNGPSPLVGLADRLGAETDAFLQVFGPTAGVVPQGSQFLADAERLRVAVIDYCQAGCHPRDRSRPARRGVRRGRCHLATHGAPHRPDRSGTHRPQHPAEPPTAGPTRLPAGLRPGLQH
jgi:hypothetical protein